MERAIGKNEKLKSFKLENQKLESFAEKAKRKSQAKLERTEQSWKEPSEVGKLLLKLESSAAVGKFWLKLESLNELEKLWLILRSSSKVPH